ncbi:EAL domain-containing protein [Luteimonas sp BLCC-B24]|uniref:putative bifunctional diguanylate cyclase/phosphodiesterase n=1 Tax=Luteimonas sp. BLCC-B24 TaxID=3025317 RepID=UPI00234E28C2|nr:EAL domain-containing protein [Luteimonas sp. BLCC-B24]MDC7806563.1 EAL domain-containing protein [Luteimonas sp. BLCC-B24]
MLVGSYNFVLVAVSYLIAAFASYVALDMAGRINATRGAVAHGWLAGGAIAMGFGIWSMHFVGMLAFKLPIPQGYDLAITLYSLLIAICSSAYALNLASGAHLPPSRLAVGALILGSGIAAMHYVGMAAMQMQPGIDYHAGWLLLSVVIAVAAAGAALWIAFALRSEGRGVPYARLLAAAVMGVAVVGMHYTGMAAARFPEGSICGAALGGSGISPTWLASLVGATTFAILGLALVTSILDRRLQERTAQLGESLQKANQELTYLALHDTLTKLPNRLLLRDRMENAIRRAVRHGRRFAVLFIDLDGFKAINDVYGHATGDRLLLQIARRLSEVLDGDADDTLARLGGDEFVVLMEIAAPDDAASLAERLMEAVAQPVALDRVELHVTTSIGIAIFGPDGTSERELLANADAAMYSAKDQGRNAYCFFEPSMNQGAHQQLAMIQDLRRALSLDQFSLHYQPKMIAPAGPLEGVEALLRWHHPEHGMVMPDRFIPLAEKTGLIIEIGRWVINEACRQLMAWREAGHNVPSVSVNLSPAQFRSPGLPAKIEDALARHGVPASSLVLEITESTAMHDPDTSLAILQRLSSLGVRISIDDFGTGYSSLLYLKRLPASELKIDRAFVRDLVPDGEDAAIVSAIIALGRTLNLSVIAEGVETESQQRLLTELGCTSLQGYHLGRPVAADEAATRF